eukprot:TRINITY_DN8634_c0_g1_i1.p1 TRINITY_DN8634_c0_g1~~TRINITY_DN8634_c0_g1_i1.p1  ORF type:complete len:151 (-),score=26.21 TRINITY_DN8634_c0_g1_i1:29-481(-)
MESTTCLELQSQTTRLIVKPTQHNMANREQGYGLTAELARKREASYNHELEASIRGWMESINGPIQGGFHEGLQSGVYLCELMNRLRPGSINKINRNNMAFMKMENIGNFLGVCQGLGLRSTDLFQTVDLYEAQNMSAVLQCLDALRRVA